MRAATYAMAATASVALTGAIVLIHIASPEVKQSLANITGHHWTAVSAISAISFGLMLVLIYVLLGPEKRNGLHKSEDLLGWSIALVLVTLAMTFGIFALYVVQYMAA